MLASGYRGHAEADIAAADGLPEPSRSTALRALRARFREDLRRDLSRYRACARALRAWRAWETETAPDCAQDVHVTISLKHNHLFNDFAHLAWIDALLNKQRDLFDQ